MEDTSRKPNTESATESAPRKRMTSALWSCEKHRTLSIAEANEQSPRKIRVIRDDGELWPLPKALAETA